MANTRDTLGDQGTLDAILSDELEELVEADVTQLAQYVLAYNKKLKMCDFTKLATINANAFAYSKLLHLILRNANMVTLNNTNALLNTPIANKYGTIYVPQELLATYQANNNWKNYFIMPISAYPNTEFGTITDSWETIINNPNYKTDYSIGDTKTVDFGKYGYMNMELVAFDADEKADGTGTANMTWIAKDCITQRAMNPGTQNNSVDGWVATDMRKWLRSDVLSGMPKLLVNGIVEVNKTYFDNSSHTTKECDDVIWLPSVREVAASSEAGQYTGYEDDGCIYELYSSNKTARQKRLLGTSWWLRSAYKGTQNQLNNGQFNGIIFSSGDITTLGAMWNLGSVAPGFCIGNKSESQYWTDLVTSIKEDTYHDLYEVGDKLPYTVGNYTYHAVIVGIDADEDATGAKAPVTFITEELWAETAKMNDTDTNTGGWTSSKMRNTTLPSIKAQLPEYVTSNIVKVKKVSLLSGSTEQVTYDDLWVPSAQEMGSDTNETSGVSYSTFFNDNSSKIKYLNNNLEMYWLRSIVSTSSSNFRVISGTGSITGNQASLSVGVAVSFCIGAVTEESI